MTPGLRCGNPFLFHEKTAVKFKILRFYDSYSLKIPVPRINQVIMTSLHHR